jgi:hypothetical protein
MFQLFEFVLASPIGAVFVSVLQDTVYAAMIITECEECGFNDLGNLLLGGIVLALVTGVAASLLWKRRQERGSAQASFVSIRSNDHRQ